MDNHPRKRSIFLNSSQLCVSYLQPLTLLIINHLYLSQHKEILIHMLAARHSTHLLSYKSTSTTPLLPSYICNSWADFAPCRKRSTFVWDERLVDIVLHQGKKWMEDIHNIYTLMLWNSKHWVGLAINLDMGMLRS